MPRRQQLILTAARGYVPTQEILAGAAADSLIAGQNLLVFGNGLLKSAKGPAAGSASGSPRPAMNYRNGFGGLSSYGSVVSFYNILFGAGSGTITVNGSSVGSTTDALVVDSGSGLVAVGVGTPGAPTLSTTPPTSGRLLGAYSLALTAIQVLGTLNSESSRGTPSAAVTFTNKKMRVTAWPATPSGCNATRDKWGLYLPFRGFPSQGPWRHLADIAMNTGLPYDFDWLDGELGHLAPLDHDAPPAAKFVFTLDNVMVVIAAGGQLYPSVPLKPSAYPPDQVVFLARGEDVTSCRSSGTSGRIALACANSLHEVISSGDDTISPIIALPRWPSEGFAGASAWCFVHETIFGIAGTMGPVAGSLDSPPDTTFAKDVKSFFEDNGFTSANGIVGYDPSINAVVFMSTASTKAICFMLEIGKWSTEITLPGAPSTAVTVNGQLLVDIGGTNYTFEGGTGTSFNGTFAFWDGNSPKLKTIVRMRCASDTTLTIQPLRDLSTTDLALATFSSAANHGNPQRLNLRNITSFSAKFSGSGSRKTIHPFYVDAIEHLATNHR